MSTPAAPLTAPVLIASALLAALPAPAAAGDRVLRAELTLPAPPAEVFKAWTTREGILSFFAPGGEVDLRVDGTYDVWFNPAGAPGERGAEGMRILDVDPPRRFAFTWNAPPSIASIRGRRTLVVLDFHEVAGGKTRLTFTHLGWGEGADWDRAFDYFDKAWGSVVLPRLAHRFEKGPVDWKTPPVAVQQPASLKRSLVEAAPAK